MATFQTTDGGMPVVILREGTKENKGREAQETNIAAAKLIADMVKTCLGPRGMDKMLLVLLETLQLQMMAQQFSKKWMLNTLQQK